MLYTHILVPTDFSPAANHALEFALEEATQHQARLTLLHVLHNHPTTEVYYITDAPQHGAGYATEFGARLPAFPTHAPEAVRRDYYEEARAQLYDLVPSTFPGTWEVQVTTGHPADAIVRTAEELEVDLIIMATHGRTGVPHMVLGSVAEKVVRHAPCPVLTLRQRARRA
jgi:universal stress protein A